VRRCITLHLNQILSSYSVVSSGWLLSVDRPSVCSAHSFAWSLSSSTLILRGRACCFLAGSAVHAVHQGATARSRSLPGGRDRKGRSVGAIVLCWHLVALAELPLPKLGVSWRFGLACGGRRIFVAHLFRCIVCDCVGRRYFQRRGLFVSIAYNLRFVLIAEPHRLGAQACGASAKGKKTEVFVAR